MPIRIEQKGLASLYGRAAVLAGQTQRAREQEQIAERRISQLRSIEAQKESQQIALEQQRQMRLLDAQLDLEQYERAKRWETDKMQLRSQADFQRGEQVRQRKLDSADSAIQQIEKEVLAGRMTEQEAYPLKLKYEMNKLGVDAPTSLLPTGDEGERFGMPPYWMRGREAPEGTPERQLYEAKLAEGISGQRTGTIPYYLDPTWLRENRDIAESVLDSHEIFFDTPEELDTFIDRQTTQAPLTNKQLDVGVRVEGEAERSIVEGLPVVTSDADYGALPSGTEFIDQSGRRWRKP